MRLSMPSLLLGVVLATVCWLVGRRAPRQIPHASPAAATSRSTRGLPLLAALVTMGVTAWLWGGWRAPALVHDEAAYLHQAATFAAGRLAMPRPVLPEFFEQFHVHVTPTFSAKYPPGHGLLLALGVGIGVPGLVVLLLAGGAAAVLVHLVRAISHPAVAILALLAWLLGDTALYFRGSYFSQATSTLCWLVGWWALWRWTATRRVGWLVAVAVAVAWMAITRPLTAVAYALPVTLVVGWHVAGPKHRVGQWRGVLLAGGVALGILALLPLWHDAVLGTWRVSPYAHYSTVYFPWDVMGFGAEAGPPGRAHPREYSQFVAEYTAVHAAHTIDALPRHLLARAAAVWAGTFSGILGALGGFALVGVVAIGAAGWVAGATVVLTLVAYLAFAHPSGWTLYYYELSAVLAGLAAIGAWRLLVPASAPAWWQRRVAGTVVVAAALMLGARAPALEAHRARLRTRQAFPTAFRQLVDRVPAARALVFVRYAPEHNVHTALIANPPDLASAPRWVVHDRGPDNVRLLRAAPDRTPYLFDEARGELQRYDLARDTIGFAAIAACRPTPRGCR